MNLSPRSHVPRYVNNAWIIFRLHTTYQHNVLNHRQLYLHLPLSSAVSLQIHSSYYDVKESSSR